MLKSLDGAAVRRWAATCCDELAAHRAEIDCLNVFPVPDQDTGSNLLATMRAGLDAVLRVEQDDDAAAALARGALMGARGNSGVIVSQVLRGFAESLAELPQRGGVALREGLRRAAELATAAVSEPAPGTVLTVLQAAAQAAATVRSDDLCDVASAAADAAAGALADTPRQLAVLARAGVVDAGGQGLVLLLRALLAVVTEHRTPPPGSAVVGSAVVGSAVVAALPARVPKAQREGGAAEYGYEVMYLLDETSETRVGALRAELAGLGDCVAIVGSGPASDEGATALWNVHVHCSDIGAAIEAGVRAGRPHRITVLRFADQDDPDQDGPDQDGRDEVALQRTGAGRAVLAMVAGAGVSELLCGEGATTVPAACTVPELLAALRGTCAPHVTVLAGPGGATEVAEAAAALARDVGQEVVIVPTPSAVHALAAMAVHDAGRGAGEDIAAMTDAVAATRRGELVLVTQEVLTCAQHRRPGDLLGMVDGAIVLVERSLLPAAYELVERMLATGGELVTVLLGRQTPPGAADMLAEYLHSRYPEVEAAVYHGDQPDSVLLVGVE